MKQEHRFVADLYRYLAPFIDPDKAIFVSLDGEAAKKGVSEKKFIDSDVPDLWFHFVGRASAVLLEAKILNVNDTITVTRGQITGWRSAGAGQHKPSAWIASDQDLKKFYFWSHSSFQCRLDDCQSKQKYPKIKLPEEHVEFDDIRSLALHIIRQA